MAIQGGLLESQMPDVLWPISIPWPLWCHVVVVDPGHPSSRCPHGEQPCPPPPPTSSPSVRFRLDDAQRLAYLLSRLPVHPLWRCSPWWPASTRLASNGTRPLRLGSSGWPTASPAVRSRRWCFSVRERWKLSLMAYCVGFFLWRRPHSRRQLGPCRGCGFAVVELVFPSPSRLPYCFFFVGSFPQLVWALADRT